jgi:hypothetical protein
MMAFEDTRLPEEVKPDYDRLHKSIKSVMTEDNYAAEEVFTAVLDQIKSYEGDEAQTKLAAKAFANAYEALASAPEFFGKIEPKLGETVNNMLSRRAEGKFVNADGETSPISEDVFLDNVSLITGSMINRAYMDKDYATKQLPDDPVVKLAYEVFMEDIITNQTAMEQQLEMQATMTGGNADDMKQHFYNEQYDMIQDTLSAARKFADAAGFDKPEDRQKAALPFLVYSALHGQYRDDEESFAEDFDENMRYLVDSTIWGSYSLADMVETYLAKDSMFQIAQVPLNPVGEDAAKTEEKKPEKTSGKEKNADAAAADTEEKKSVKSVPLPQAVDYFESQGNYDAARGAVKAAFVPLMHEPTGKQMIFPLAAIFDKIDTDPDYRQKVVGDIKTGLPPMTPLSAMVANNTVSKATTPGQLISSHSNLDAFAGTELGEQMKEVLAPLENDIMGKYVFAMQNLPANEDTAACAEYLMINAIVSVENVTRPTNRLKSTLFPGMSNMSQADYFYIDERDDPKGNGMLNIVPVEAFAPEIERSVDHLLAVQKIFAEQPKEGDTELTLRPQFQTASPEVQKNFKRFMEQKAQDLSGMQQILINTAKKKQADAEAKKAAEEEAKRKAEAEAAAKAAQLEKDPDAETAPAETVQEKTQTAETATDKSAEKPAKRKKRFGLF